MNGFLKAAHGIFVFLLILIKNPSVTKRKKKKVMRKLFSVRLRKAEETNNAIKFRHKRETTRQEFKLKQRKNRTGAFRCNLKRHGRL